MEETQVATEAAPVQGDNYDELYDKAMSDKPYEIADKAPVVEKTPEYELTVNGKVVKADIEKLKKWASQGYDYPQRMQELNQTKAQIAAKQKELSVFEQTYKPIDDWAKANPDNWNKLVETWKAQQNQPQVTGHQLPGNNPELEALRNELSELKKFKESFEQEKQQERIKQEDEALNAEIGSIRKEYPYLDLEGIDEMTGKSLLVKTLEYANEKGIQSFSDAFKALNLQLILKKAEEAGKEKVGLDIQKRNRLGLLGTPQAPQKGQLQPAKNIKQKTYDDLVAESIKELGLG